jgi:hypothetical protein
MAGLVPAIHVLNAKTPAKAGFFVMIHGLRTFMSFRKIIGGANGKKAKDESEAVPFSSGRRENWQT